MKNAAIDKRAIQQIDFNCDLAQSFGIYKNDIELEFLDYVSSVNISCGFHAGDPIAIKNALVECKNKNIAIGAHIGFADIQGFGYRLMDLSAEEIETQVIYQIGALASFAKSYGLEIEHVRPHGAMYKFAAENVDFSMKIARAIQKFDKWLVYVGAAGPVLDKVNEEVGIKTASELFLDKRYNFDGTVNFNEDDIVNTEYSMNRLNRLLNSSSIDNTSSGVTVVKVDTLHFANKAINSTEIVKRACEIIKPTPVQYNRAVGSGWINTSKDS